uniref:Dual specificity protein phosphatase 15 n=1 Tax=Ciona savignyi TaxID=51511 RepID=H2ZR70_CIOSA
MIRYKVRIINRKMGNGMNKILPGLFIGNFRDAENIEQLQRNNITHILSIYDNPRPIFKDKIYLCIKASDTPDQDLSPFFEECADFIHQARLKGGAVLVHCLAGVSRSVTVSIAYITSVTDYSWRDTLCAVRQSRLVANPNSGFQRQLQEFEDNNLHKARKRMLKKFGESKLKASDHDAIEQLLDKHRKKEEEQIKSPPPEQGSGSTNSSFPLNKADDVVSYNWNSKKRGGMIVDVDEN